jgi:hypothetical protein
MYTSLCRNVYGKRKDSRIAKTILKNNTMEGITLPDVLGHLQLQYQDGVPARRQQKV